MNSRNKRYLKSLLITIFLVITVLLLPFFNYKHREKNNSRHQNAEISFVTVKKKASPKKQDHIKKIPVNTENTIPSENPAINQPEEEPEVDETHDEYKEDSQTGVSDAEKAEIEKASSTYKEYVLSRISAKKTYPLPCRAKGQQGRVKIHICIAQTGDLLTAEIVKTCPHELLNEAAITAVKKAAPFKKMPEKINSNLDFIFAMDFLIE